jgi:hypothetical protein
MAKKTTTAQYRNMAWDAKEKKAMENGCKVL